MRPGSLLHYKPYSFMDRKRKALLLRPSLSFLSFFLFFLGCVNSQDQNDKGLRIEKEDSFRPELSEKTYKVRDPNCFRDENGHTYLINNNFSLYDTVNQLEVYLLGEEKLVQRIELMPLDMGYFTKIKDYLYLDHDSILYTVTDKRDPWKTRFILIDSSEKVIQKWTVDGSIKGKPSFLVGGNSLYPPLHYRNKTIFSLHWVNSKKTEGAAFNTPCMARIVLSDSKKARVEPFGRYPEIYRRADRKFLSERSLRDYMSYPLALFDVAMGKEALVLSFPASDTLYRYDLKGAQIGKRACKSRYASPQDLWDELRKKGDRIKKNYGPHFKDLPHYTSLVYDPYRDLYYRIANLGKKGWSLMVLSSDLELLQEEKLGQGSFQDPPIPMKDRVLLRKNNVDGLVFVSFKIEKKNDTTL